MVDRNSQFIARFGDPHSNPKGYPIIRIRDVTDVLTGATPSRNNSLYYGGDIPWIKTGEIEAGLIDHADEYITQEAISSTNCKILPINTIMIAMYGQGKTRGTAGLLKIPAATNQACAAIIPCSEFHPVYLYRFFVNEYDALRGMGRGAQQANLNLSMIKDYPIMAVPIQQQLEFVIFIQQSDKSKLMAFHIWRQR